MPRRGTMAGARVVACTVSLVTALALAYVVAFGLFWITTDWSALECFDGDEPGCDEPRTGESGLGAIRASSWIVGAVAVAALAAAFRISTRLRRWRQFALVLALNGVVIGIGLLLWSRL